MNKIILTIFTVIMLTGCGYSYVTASQLEKVLSQCSENGGVKIVKVDSLKRPIFHSVHCNDGAIFNYSSFKENK